MSKRSGRVRVPNYIKKSPLSVRIKTLYIQKLRSYAFSSNQTMNEIVEKTIMRYLRHIEKNRGPINIIDHPLKTGPKPYSD